MCNERQSSGKLALHKRKGNLMKKTTDIQGSSKVLLSQNFAI